MCICVLRIRRFFACVYPSCTIEMSSRIIARQKRARCGFFSSPRMNLTNVMYKEDFFFTESKLYHFAFFLSFYRHCEVDIRARKIRRR